MPIFSSAFTKKVANHVTVFLPDSSCTCEGGGRLDKFCFRLSKADSTNSEFADDTTPLTSF